jgi:hypothetical protein
MRVLVVVTGQQRRGEVEDNKSLDLEVTALLPSVHLKWTSGSLSGGFWRLAAQIASCCCWVGGFVWLLLTSSRPYEAGPL